MRNFAKAAKVLALGAAMTFGATQAVNAASISFGGQAATDGSGLTSSFIDPSNLLDGSTGFFIETFDQATQLVGAPTGSLEFNVDPSFDTDCAVNGAGSGIAVSVSDPGAVGVRIGSVENTAAAPANDSTCFGYVTNKDIGGTTSLELDYSALLAANDDTGITYLGFYWGSVDNYNDFEFYSGNSLVTTITGSQLLAALNGEAGNQQDPESNVYVNIDFNFGEQFDRLVINTSGIAGEFDNIVVGLSQRPVPAPAGIAIFALGLIALGLRGRSKK